MLLVQKSHIKIMGANANATLCVPNCCNENRPMRIMHVIPTIKSAKKIKKMYPNSSKHSKGVNFLFQDTNALEKLEVFKILHTPFSSNQNT